MKATTTPVVNAIRSEYDVTALPSLQAEWNFNRYVPVTASNTPAEVDEGFDIEIFPIESIVTPQRPTKGMLKGIVQEAILSDSYHTPRMPRFHIASVDDTYKYWISPFISNSAGVITGVNPTIIYGGNVATNKISITVENSWASPDTYTIQTTTNFGGSWTNVGSPAIQNDGKMELWWSGTGWVTARPTDLTATTLINGIRLVVTKLTSGKRIDGTVTVYKSPATNSFFNTTGANAHFSLIEISARLVVDLTSRVISTGDQFDAGDVNHLTPMGTITTNDGNVKLWNGDGYLSRQNTSSQLWNLLEPNVEMNLSYIYDIPPLKHTVQQFKMFVNEWAEDNEQTVTVSLSDESKFLKEIKPRETKYENHTLAQIVYRLCDSVGFTNYVIDPDPNTFDFQIPVWWTDGEQTLWEIFDELAQATQSLIYFDAWGKLRVKTREDAYPRTTNPVWNLRAAKSGIDLPDIVSLQQTDTYEANNVKIIYQSTKWADEVNGFPEFTTVWSPEETTVLRSSPLIRNLNPNDDYIWLSESEAKIWPYEGLVQINGETIRFEGKMFNYHINGVWNSKLITDADQFEKFNSQTASNGRWINHFDGRLKITEREAWNTTIDTHRVDAAGYAVTRFGPSDVVTSNAGFTHNKQRSTVSLAGGGRLNGPQDFMVATRGSQSDTGWRHYGTRMKFTSGNHTDQRAGLVFNVVGNRGGYYVELTPTAMLSAKERQSRKEISFYTITGLQPNVRIPAKGIEGGIFEDRWHNVDIYFGWDNQRVMVWIDGKLFIDINVPAGQQFSPNGKFGMFVRGRTECEFEYLYAIARADEPIPEEDFSSLHAIEGYHTGLELKREWVYKERRRKRRVKKKHNKFKKNFQFMDEFGPYVHEIREFDVKFEPAPVQYSKLFVTNTWSVVVIDYRADSFGGRFTLANSERFHAVVHGEDSLTFPGVDGKVINQQLIVYGRALVIGEDEEVVVKNEAQIKARGEITTELSSRWIQTNAAATALGKWITSHWGKTIDQLEVEVFGNPLFEIGDVVAIDYPAKSMTTTTHQYFVTSISTEFSEGLTTTLTLHRKS